MASVIVKIEIRTLAKDFCTFHFFFFFFFESMQSSGYHFFAKPTTSEGWPADWPNVIGGAEDFHMHLSLSSLYNIIPVLYEEILHSFPW